MQHVINTNYGECKNDKFINMLCFSQSFAYGVLKIHAASQSKEKNYISIIFKSPLEIVNYGQ